MNAAQTLGRELAALLQPNAPISPYSEPHYPDAFIPTNLRADESTYLSQHPGVEPYLDGAVLDDNKQDLEATIGKRTVRLRDVSHDRAQARWDRKAVFVCGVQYRTLSNVDRLSALDRLTAPFGGREKCGRAYTHWGFGTNQRGRYVNPTILLSVRLPQALSDLLAVDGVRREVWITTRDSLDSMYTWNTFATVRNPESGAQICIRANSWSLRAKHTRALLRTPTRIEEWAARLPVIIARHAEALRTMAAHTLSYSDLVRHALVIANDGNDEVDGADLAEAVWGVAEHLVDMVVTANGRTVPKSPIPGVFTAYQLFEAACAYDARHARTATTVASATAGVTRANRVLDGDTYGDVALTMFAGVVLDEEPAPMPADWIARRTSALNLPALDPMPDGLSLPEHTSLEQIRLLHCTMLASCDTDADERIDALMRITDPLHVRAIVCPHLPVIEALPEESEAYVAVHGEVAP